MNDHSSKSRDRFAAFALSGADVLLETDMNGRVLFSTGATESLIGYSAELMTGRLLTQIMVPDDADMVREVLDRVAITGRVTGMIVNVARVDGKHYPFSLSGVSVVEMKGALHFTMARLKGLSAKIAFEPGVVDARVFMNLANDLIGSGATAGDSNAMTLMQFDAATLFNRMSPEQRKAFENSLTGHLRAWSLAGASITRVADGKYGFLHEDSPHVPAKTTERIEALSKEHDPTGQGIAVQARAIDLNLPEASSEVRLAAFETVFKTFETEGVDALDRTSLSGLVMKGIKRLLGGGAKKSRERMSVVPPGGRTAAGAQAAGLAGPKPIQSPSLRNRAHEQRSTRKQVLDKNAPVFERKKNAESGY